MRSLSDTLARLKRAAASVQQNPPASTRLKAIGSFGSNPGQLNGWIYVPATSRRGAPMVVVLHGCTQTASGYDEASGWSRLADQERFVVLYPEQKRSNNPNLCFNWFLPADTARGAGEALSIRQMIAAVQARHGTDPRRVFVTGLSAGGAMTATMLATYPDVFAGGAVIAGLPFGVATSVPEAFDRMRGQGGPPKADLSDLIYAASRHSGEWPTLSVWHGTADATVAPANASALVEQWRSLHGATMAPSRNEIVQGHRRRVWCNSAGREVIEEYSITGLGHGAPLDTFASGHGENAAPFMLHAGISSTRFISRFWGIVTDQAASNDESPTNSPRSLPALRSESANRASQKAHTGASVSQTIRKTIDDALREAGLMK